MMYSDSIFNYQRRQTREVKVGDVGIGGDNPIRVQSMTIADTKNTDAVVAETKGLVEAGCEIVRITAPTIHHAENLKNIRDRLRQDGIKVPLVADIHFTPQAAMIAADYVEKVRVNPGNYADRKLFAVKEYSDAEYESELQRMAEKFIPLVKKCKSNGVAMRIGTNHGSLSDRIMNRYGDTPEGMVESALEFARLCESESYYDIIFSMKASSPFIMIAAYRLLVQRMRELGMDYPLHLGVTEAGEGEDGRIKSAIGIGSLLEDGIGDTVRVSLTEDSVYEIPVARQLVSKFNLECGVRSAECRVDTNANEFNSKPHPALRAPRPCWDPIERERRESVEVSGSGLSLGAKNPLAVFSSFDVGQKNAEQKLLEFLTQAREVEQRGEVICLKGSEDWELLTRLKKTIQKLQPELKVGIQLNDFAKAVEAVLKFDWVVLLVDTKIDVKQLKAISEKVEERDALLELRFDSLETFQKNLNLLKLLDSVLLSLESTRAIYDYRRMTVELHEAQIKLPIHLYLNAEHFEDASLEGASALGGLLMDGIGDSVEIGNLNLQESIRLSFNILQASRLRISKAEFIACPSCGRTLFDLQTTTQRIKQKTAHLKGVKIAIMGCIVNGPGEMADADFGYVGGGPGKIQLYVGKDCVEKNIPTEIADQKLIELIREHGRWVEPNAA